MTVTVPVITATRPSEGRRANAEFLGSPDFNFVDEPTAAHYRAVSEPSKSLDTSPFFWHPSPERGARHWNDRLRDLVRLYAEDEEDDVRINEVAAARATRLFIFLDSAGYAVETLNIFGDEDGYLELQFQDQTHTYTVTVGPEGPYEYRSVQIHGPNVVRYHVETDRTLAGLLNLRVDR